MRPSRSLRNSISKKPSRATRITSRAPDTAKEKPQEGEVIAVGEGKIRDDGSRQTLDVKKGDRVLFGKYSGSEIKIDGEELLIMREDEILGIIERAGAASGKKGGRSSFRRLPPPSGFGAFTEVGTLK